MSEKKVESVQKRKYLKKLVREMKKTTSVLAYKWLEEQCYKTAVDLEPEDLPDFLRDGRSLARLLEGGMDIFIMENEDMENFETAWEYIQGEFDRMHKFREKVKKTDPFATTSFMSSPEEIKPLGFGDMNLPDDYESDLNLTDDYESEKKIEDLVNYMKNIRER